ncbi:MAG: PilZ domain-containing protein [Deltaproteobacteria bacterium]|nr:PilZ domain-containing protein [Deltaproteobacteria bacterium]
MGQADVEYTGEGAVSSGKVIRREARRAVTGFVADIADSASVLTGGVKNISRGGFRMTGIPDLFTGSEHSYTTVVNGDGNYFRLVAKPCWIKESGEKGVVDIGFKILDAPWEWVDLTDSN